MLNTGEPLVCTKMSPINSFLRDLINKNGGDCYADTGSIY
nr:MAG TPA_asm: hypothetical protein [Caudoviricetes sp.]